MPIILLMMISSRCLLRTFIGTTGRVFYSIQVQRCLRRNSGTFTKEDKMATNVVKYSGAPVEILRTADEVKAIRVGRAAAQAEAAKAEQMKAMSEVARNAGQAQMAFQGGGGGASK